MATPTLIGSGQSALASTATGSSRTTSGSTFSRVGLGVAYREAAVAPADVTSAASKVWDGAAWVPNVPKVWNGTAWVPRPAEAWDGAGWQS